jgi:hypothetical protein
VAPWRCDRHLPRVRRIQVHARSAPRRERCAASSPDEPYRPGRAPHP